MARNLDELIPRRRPEPIVHRTLAEVEEEWNREAEKYASELRPGPLYLLGERRRPLVRSELRRGARRSGITAALCVLVPLATFVVCAWFSDSQRTAYFRSWMGRMPNWDWPDTAVCTFVCLWPALMFAGAALSAAMAVISDRARHTASQIVLTPVRGETIAAARILPWPGPFLLGVLAVLPLYIWAGSWEPLCPGGVMFTPLSFLPMRPLAVLAIATGAQPPEVSIGGVACGLFMLVSDATLVWAAAHWGATYAVWLGNLPGVMLFLLWRLLYISVLFVVWLLPTFICLGTSRLGRSRVEDPINVVLLVPVVIYLLVLVWYFPARGAVRSALVEFLRYDRLAGDDFRPGYFKRFRVRVRSEGPPRL